MHCKNIRISTDILWRVFRLSVRRFTDTNVYGTAVPLKRGKLTTKYLWIYGYFFQYAHSKNIRISVKVKPPLTETAVTEGTFTPDASRRGIARRARRIRCQRTLKVLMLNIISGLCRQSPRVR